MVRLLRVLGRDERLRRGVLEAEQDYGNERWTVDYPEDLERVREIVKRLGRRAGYREILGIQPSRT